MSTGRQSPAGVAAADFATARSGGSSDRVWRGLCGCAPFTAELC
jgi:hypothetical protein